MINKNDRLKKAKIKIESIIKEFDLAGIVLLTSESDKTLILKLSTTWNSIQHRGNEIRIVGIMPDNLKDLTASAHTAFNMRDECFKLSKTLNSLCNLLLGRVKSHHEPERSQLDEISVSE